MKIKLSQRLVLFYIWASIMVAVYFYSKHLYDGSPLDFEGSIELSPFLYLPIGTCLVSVIFRWLIMPRSKNFLQLQVSFIIGVAMANAGVFYVIFLFLPESGITRSLLFWMAIVCLLQFFSGTVLNRKRVPTVRSLCSGYKIPRQPRKACRVIYGLDLLC